jgi:hypothetical protein
MAEKSKDKKDEKKHSHHSGGEMHFGLEVLLFIVGIFILWILAGGAKKPTDDQKPFMTQPPTNQIIPGNNN